MSKDYQQVLLDVRRSLRRFPPGEKQVLPRSCRPRSSRPNCTQRDPVGDLVLTTGSPSDPALPKSEPEVLSLGLEVVDENPRGFSPFRATGETP